MTFDQENFPDLLDAQNGLDARRIDRKGLRLDNEHHRGGLFFDNLRQSSFGWPRIKSKFEEELDE